MQAGRPTDRHTYRQIDKHRHYVLRGEALIAVHQTLHGGRQRTDHVLHIGPLRNEVGAEGGVLVLDIHQRLNHTLVAGSKKISKVATMYTWKKMRQERNIKEKIFLVPSPSHTADNVTNKIDHPNKHIVFKAHEPAAAVRALVRRARGGAFPARDSSSPGARACPRAPWRSPAAARRSQLHELWTDENEKYGIETETLVSFVKD